MLRALVLVALLSPSVALAWPPLRECQFGPGALPAETLPPGRPHGDQIPIDHIIVLMQENRSFDHYFGQLYRQGQPRARREPRRAWNPDPTGERHRIRAFHQTLLCEVTDLAHSWNKSHDEWNGGQMDGFTAANADDLDPTGRRAMGYYTRHDLRFYYALYATFAMGDRYFSSVLGPTYPNRFYLLAGTSFGHIRNDLPAGEDQFDQPTIFDLLDDAGVSWKIYVSPSAVPVPFAVLFATVRNLDPDHIVPLSEYYADAAAGTLPQVGFVDPTFIGPPNVESDEHPPANPQVGQTFVAEVVQALFDSPNWRRSALFLTYDEHGGYYDHVPPPKACVPDDIPPMLEPGDTPGKFNRLGIRVPVVVVSPYARPHFVSHRVHDHTSILRFIETRFDLPALTRRDANAFPMLEFFDFRHKAFRKPPSLPLASLDLDRAAECPGPPPAAP